MTVEVLGAMKRGVAGPDIRPVATSAVEELVASIRGLISDKRLGVGDSLPSEREMCGRFETSRNTVREAMRMLKAYGVVDVRPKVGAVITDNRMVRVFDLFSFNTIEISRKTFADIQGFRCMVEVDSVERIILNATDGDIADLRSLNQAMAEAPSKPAAAEADFSFHLRLISILDNEAVREVYRIMKPVILRIMEKGKSRQDFGTVTFAQHAAIVDALEAGDRINYQYALQFHLRAGFDTFGKHSEEN
ncbi:MAG: FCD domain-containing protein [Cucumibacter sp.]